MKKAFALYGMAQAFMKNICSIRDISVRFQKPLPTLKDQFAKRKPQGYKRHLRK